MKRSRRDLEAKNLTIVFTPAYFDQIRERFYTAEDACGFEDWADEATQFRFARHPLGFSVFLRPSNIAGLDEYTSGDPYGVIGNESDLTPFHQRRLNCTIQLIERAIGPTAHKPRILDIACGAGHITAEISKRWPSADISAIDCSLTAIAQASRMYTGIDFAVADAFAPPYASAEFDVVVLNNIWEHVTDPLRLLEAAGRVLKPDGTVIISTPSRYRLSNIVRVLTGRPVKLISKHHVTEYSVGQVIEQLRYCGYETTVLNHPAKLPTSTLSSYLVQRMVTPLVRLYLSLCGSHHSIEWTVFYSARKTNESSST